MVTTVLIALVAVVFLVLSWRLYVLRRTERSSGLFPSPGNSSPRSWERNRGSYQPYRVPVVLPVAGARRPSRQVRAADTDAAGRRLGSLGVSDSNRKDELPAYDKFGGPPRYPQSLHQGLEELPFNMPPLQTVTEDGADNSLTRDRDILKSPPPAYLDPRS
ncbi:hypothetical protein EDD16DRAFT_1630278 [Pisolithus croceorrhizus]|nr:hypothetical protein EDD16DRAFT_1630278 [Pisolithus croceorrhizus]KAI6110339.1 hypothetical protein EV401DRAFT_1994230 [Pisolithus croceorrhizus]KAI6118289.1 hypothetical protein F5141DRAFT_1097609 [Pisolithus sp. B1]KAI6161076.1 hypothetical protein EDD17DRAFT_1592196 [Pisolithus thermaeus]